MFLKRGPNSESHAAHTHPKNTRVTTPGLRMSRCHWTVRFHFGIVMSANTHSFTVRSTATATQSTKIQLNDTYANCGVLCHDQRWTERPGADNSPRSKIRWTFSYHGNVNVNHAVVKQQITHHFLVSIRCHAKNPLAPSQYSIESNVRDTSPCCYINAKLMTTRLQVVPHILSRSPERKDATWTNAKITSVSAKARTSNSLIEYFLFPSPASSHLEQKKTAVQSWRECSKH